MIHNRNILDSMRTMEWQKAKGRLLAILETYWPEYDNDGREVDNGFKRANDLIQNFIREMDDI